MNLKNSFKNNFIKRALTHPVKIHLPEYQDSRIKEAISELRYLGFNVLDQGQIKGNREKYLKLISKKKFTLNWSNDMKNIFLSSSLNYGLVALENNDVDCLIAGAKHSTSEVLKSSIRIIGLNKESNWISSAFFMIAPDNDYSYTFSDCGVIPDPTSEQLCSIGYEASELHRLLSNKEPVVAFLSFSSKGSAQHYKVAKVQKAFNLFTKKYKNIRCDGEIQFDAAINNSISKRKKSVLNGEANVFIFPDLDSANIAYKITEHLAGFQALGPLIQGLHKPVHDLSRGCKVDDIVSVSVIAALQKIYNK